MISALRRKRAELAGEILTARRQIEKLRDDLDNIDRTLRVFDPAIRIEKIRPVVRRKGALFFHHGECGRAIMDTLRRSGKPLSAQEIADSLVINYRLDTDKPNAERVPAQKVRMALFRYLKRAIIETRGDTVPVRWSLRPQ